MEPLALGTRVRYHGSLQDKHGEYDIVEHWDHGTLRMMRPDLSARLADEWLAEAYPDGAYVLWPVGVPYKFGERDKSLSSVRRESITVVEDDG